MSTTCAAVGEETASLDMGRRRRSTPQRGVKVRRKSVDDKRREPWESKAQMKRLEAIGGKLDENKGRSKAAVEGVS